MPTPITAVLFDLDNTLFDREAAFRGVAEDFCTEFLASLTSAGRDEAVALMVEWDEDGYSNRRVFREAILAQWPEADLDMDALNDWYRLSMAEHTLPDDSVNDFLGELNRAGLPWGIVTNGNGPNQRSKCGLAGLSELAGFIIASEDQGYAKPDPRIFRDAMTALGSSDPEGVLFVGDNPVNDIDGARGFGMRTAWVSRGLTFPAELTAPDHAIVRVTDLRGVLGL